MSFGVLISPIELRTFLRANGWKLLPAAIKDRLYVLSNDRYPRRQLIFPMDSAAPDYAETVENVISKLAEMTGQGTPLLRSMIETVQSDVLRLRVYFEGNDRSLPLPFATGLISGAEKLLKSAACTAVMPRTNHPRLSLAEATQFIENARFGQTEAGSFILQISCPVHAMEIQGALQLDERDAPFVRQVTLSLHLALTQLIDAIEADMLDELVEELKSSKAPLISANLCEALSAMHDQQINNSLDVSFNWSSSSRAGVQTYREDPLRFQHDYFSRIDDVQAELKAVEKDDEDTFIGTVERLEGEMGSDGRRSGAVMLSLLLPEGETVRARTSLNPDDYVIADRAHMSSNTYVRLTGRLRTGRQPRQLTDLKHFGIVD
ncbi:hypothetical protein GOB10_18425 [Sinorhizobium meliloti]|uniref:hypothetical protein n=1 Tax=Rhizobium meliloti TaxID=382 RepID=UPI00299E9A49|nr:hypothetical protein [Sinorhizobium meliloti]MDW9897724.1 hypothetical protein [Sinorhizobium meliloti]MDX0345433.1 hypothetical protein [Sinorhizobium meliloti]MDX0856773.1 hypothetical protein [Sinorhizobium medicae]MDX1211764.1 hypothetical protein [Sinorhizobium medicae]